MGYISKEGYERKREYAISRNKKQKENTSLSEEQHKAIASLCALRHDVHSCDRESLWHSNLCFEQNIIDVSVQLRDAGLDGIRVQSLLDEEVVTAWEWYELLDDEDRAKYNNNSDEFFEANIGGIYNAVEEWNRSVELILKGIDEKHGTSYAPTGGSRGAY